MLSFGYQLPADGTSAEPARAAGLYRAKPEGYLSNLHLRVSRCKEWQSSRSLSTFQEHLMPATSFQSSCLSLHFHSC